MNTHILIPIAIIEEKLNMAKAEYEEFRDKSHHVHIETLAANIETLNWLLILGKQISLDEKDLEEKAEEIAMSSFKLVLTPIETYKEILHQRLGFKLGYKQALKNLI